VISLNGNGELTGSHWINESGLLETPILLTNTHSVGVVRDAVIAWGNRHFPAPPGEEEAFSLPVVGETYDGTLNDINGMHVHPSTCGPPWILPAAARFPRATWAAAPA